MSDHYEAKIEAILTPDEQSARTREKAVRAAEEKRVSEHRMDVIESARVAEQEKVTRHREGVIKLRKAAADFITAAVSAGIQPREYELGHKEAFRRVYEPACGWLISQCFLVTTDGRIFDCQQEPSPTEGYGFQPFVRRYAASEYLEEGMSWREQAPYECRESTVDRFVERAEEFLAKEGK